MAIKRGSKVDMSSSSASMTDLMFLLLIFLMIATTLINSNALKLTLPKSNALNQDKTSITVSINSDMQYFVEDQAVQFSEIEQLLRAKLGDAEDPIVSLHADQSVPIGEVVKVMNIAKANNYKLDLATAPE